MKNLLTAQLLAVSVGLALAPAALAEIYRWVDEQGQVHFSQTPPAQGTAEELELRDSSNGAELVTPGMRAFSQQRAEERQHRAQAQAQQQAQARKAQRVCSAAQAQLAALDARTARRLAIEQDDGSWARATEEQFQARRQEMLTLIDRACTDQ